MGSVSTTHSHSAGAKSEKRNSSASLRRESLYSAELSGLKEIVPTKYLEAPRRSLRARQHMAE